MQTTSTGTTEVALVAAFTKDGAGGNLAGVVLDAGAIPVAERQRIAAVVAVPETAFVHDLGDGVYDVTFFTPVAQVPDCGHATVGAFALLVQRGMLSAATAVKRTTIGDRAIERDGERIFMDQPRPALTPFARAGAIAASLALAPDALAGTPVIADHGVRFILVETTRDALAAAVPDPEAIAAISAEADAYGYYVYARDAHGCDATIRMFAPRIGIPEEPATGMAAGLLGGLLAHDAERASFRFEQGALMPRPSPSELIVRVEADRIRVGGTAALVRTMQA